MMEEDWQRVAHAPRMVDGTGGQYVTGEIWRLERGGGHFLAFLATSTAGFGTRRLVGMQWVQDVPQQLTKEDLEILKNSHRDRAISLAMPPRITPEVIDALREEAVQESQLPPWERRPSPQAERAEPDPFERATLDLRHPGGVLGELSTLLGKITAKHPPYNSLHEGLGKLMEEFDELQARVFARESLRDLDATRKECLDVAAVALRMVHAIDSGRGRA